MIRSHSPEQSASFEGEPQEQRFKRLVENVYRHYRWASDGTDEESYATTFRATVSINRQPAILRCGIIDTEDGVVHRLVLTEAATIWSLDLLEGETAVRAYMKDTEYSDARAIGVSFDDEHLGQFLGVIESALDQLYYDKELEWIAAGEASAALYQLEEMYHRPSI